MMIHDKETLAAIKKDRFAKDDREGYRAWLLDLMKSQINDIKKQDKKYGIDNIISKNQASALAIAAQLLRDA
jgi:hypothetical protein